ncbi:MAG: glycosyltransferase family 1 protein [bacterium]
MTMIIGIIATPAFKKPRTGVEEYTYQLIKHLTMLEESKKHCFILYSQDNTEFDFKLPKNFKIKILRWQLPMWTQLRLSYELLKRKPDVLFSPLGPLPLIYPKKLVVTLHGLEYEYLPKAYKRFNRYYIRYNNKRSLKRAKKIIAISEATKRDLVKLYKGDVDKISVVCHGIASVIPDFPSVIPAKAGIYNLDSRFRGNNREGGGNDKEESGNDKYILYLGRIETKKNIQGLIKAFNLLKQKYNVLHKLVLAGMKGWDFDKVVQLCHCEERPKGATWQSCGSKQSTDFILKNDDIIITGYISEDQKWQLLQNADCFAFPSFYEGFGIPILEAQKVGCPILTSNVSSMPEVAGDGAVLVNPNNIEEICEGLYKIISDENFKKNLIKKGHENVENFSWLKCTKKTLQVITK